MEAESVVSCSEGISTDLFLSNVLTDARLGPDLPLRSWAKKKHFPQMLPGTLPHRTKSKNTNLDGSRKYSFLCS